MKEIEIKGQTTGSQTDCFLQKNIAEFQKTLDLYINVRVIMIKTVRMDKETKENLNEVEK